MDFNQEVLVKEILNKSSPRRMPGSGQLITLDSGMRRNDGSWLVQDHLKTNYQQF